MTPTSCFYLFFFNDTATTEIYTLSLHDALPISLHRVRRARCARTRDFRLSGACRLREPQRRQAPERDRKSTRLNSSHGYISYAVFCLKKKKKTRKQQLQRKTTTSSRYGHLHSTT